MTSHAMAMPVCCEEGGRGATACNCVSCCRATACKQTVDFAQEIDVASYIRVSARIRCLRVTYQ